MRAFAPALLALLLATLPAQADEALRREILAAYEAINKAFEAQDRPAIEALATSDHVAITSYYDGAVTIAEQLKTADELIFSQTPVSAIEIEPLGTDGAVQRFTAEMSGSFKGRPVPAKAAVTLIWVKEDGKWKERLYQETPLD